MLTDPITAPDATSADDLAGRYAGAVAAVAREHADAGVIDAATLEALRNGDAEAVDLRDAASVLALDGGPRPETLLSEWRDHLLLEMSAAIVGVDGLAAAIDGDRTPQELQAAVEGRGRMSLAEFAAIRLALARRG